MRAIDSNDVKLKVMAALALALLPTAALAQTHTFQDTKRREIGRSITNQNGTTYYDAMGRNIGRSVNQNGTTTIYDVSGRRVGSIRTKGR
jgi:hypothetical protein